MNESPNYDFMNLFLEECHKFNSKLVKFEYPETENFEEYIIKKYFEKETVKVGLFLNVKRAGRTDEEIEQCVRELKVKFIFTLINSGFQRVANLLDIKIKFKIIE